MTKSILIDRLCVRRKVPAALAEQIVNAIFDSIERALDQGDRTEIRGFGSFELRTYEGYVGRNPRTGSQVEVKAKRLPFFKAGKELKDRVENAAQRDRRPPAAISSPAPRAEAADSHDARATPNTTATHHEASIAAP
jgi:integration host factor subunit beta